MHLFELTRKLVDIESVSGNEAKCSHFLRDYLAGQGFETEMMPVEGNRANVFAVRGKPDVVLSTHIDTVPPFMPSREDDEFIYGRGACDAKGILASQVAAGERLAAEGVTDFGVLFLVGEETLSEGARVANQSPRGSRFIINGEPTENKLAVGTKGTMRVNVKARGRTAHSAYPHLGESAIEKLLDALDRVRGMPLPRDPVLGEATLNIGVISGGRAANVIPDEATAELMYRTVTNTSELREQVEKLLKGRCDYEVIRETPTIAMEKLDGFETDVVAFTTDIPNLTRWGRPLLLGPGTIHVAHTDHECVRKAELERAVELYCKLVRELKARA